MLLRLVKAFAERGVLELAHRDGARCARVARDLASPWLFSVDVLQGGQLVTHQVFPAAALALDDAIASGFVDR